MAGGLSVMSGRSSGRLDKEPTRDSAQTRVWLMLSGESHRRELDEDCWTIGPFGRLAGQGVYTSAVTSSSSRVRTGPW